MKFKHVQDNCSVEKVQKGQKSTFLWQKRPLRQVGRLR